MAGKGKKTPPKTKRNLRGEAAANVSTSGSESSEEETNEEVTQMLRDIKKSQQFLADKFDAFEKIVAKLLTENKNLNDNITTLQQNSAQQEQKIENMFTEVNYYKQKLLEKDVVIGGLPNLENIKPETVLEN
jgi:Mg2+ and Co2+ transporter CorA